VDGAFSEVNLLTDNRAMSREFSRQVLPLQQTTLRSDLFDDESIFAKALGKTLDEGQLAAYQKALLERSSFRPWAAVHAVIRTLGNDLGLSTEQQRKFVEQLLEEIRPPKRFGQNDYWFVLHHAAKLPEAKIRPIFDKPQWQMLISELTQARGIGQWLKDKRYVSGEGSAVGKSSAELPPVPVE
jgi:hypothetical protein